MILVGFELDVKCDSGFTFETYIETENSMNAMNKRPFKTFTCAKNSSNTFPNFVQYKQLKI